MHKIDAKALHKSDELIKLLKDNRVEKIDKVIFNFPCVPSEASKTQDAQLSEIEENKKMIEEFFKSLNELEKVANIQISQVCISHKTKSSFRAWQMHERSTKSDFKFDSSIVFDKDNFPLYQNKKVRTQKGSFPIQDAKLYVFSKQLTENTLKPLTISSVWELNEECKETVKRKSY